MTIEQTATAFVNGTAAKCHNASTDGQVYTLHKTVIARRVSNGVEFNWGGYYTPTTANHMKTVMGAMGVNRHVSYSADRRDGINKFIIPG